MPCKAKQNQRSEGLYFWHTKFLFSNLFDSKYVKYVFNTTPQSHISASLDCRSEHQIPSQIPGYSMTWTWIFLEAYQFIYLHVAPSYPSIQFQTSMLYKLPYIDIDIRNLQKLLQNQHVFSPRQASFHKCQNDADRASLSPKQLSISPQQANGRFSHHHESTTECFLTATFSSYPRQVLWAGSSSEF